MPIKYDETTKTFNLQAGRTSYVMQVVHDAYLVHLYWGPRVRNYAGSRALIYKDRGLCPNPTSDDRAFSLDTLPQEYPQFGNGDYRRPAYGTRDVAGSRISNLIYMGHDIMAGKPSLEGLPATFGTSDEVETLVVHLADEVSGLCVDLSYSAFADLDVIVRSVRFENRSEKPLALTSFLSMSLDIREADFDVLTLYGKHNEERTMDRRPLTSGVVEVGSVRGTSSPHQAPFMALLRPDATEQTSEVLAAHFVYSGNFVASAQVDPYRNVRFQMGINPLGSEWLLGPQEHFQTPEVVLVRSDAGLTGMSHTFHQLYQEHLSRSPWTHRTRPILANNWEATFFQFDEEKLLALADRAAQVGIELFVLDDGWFGHRDNDDSSLGDWVCDMRKLPQGLSHLSDEIHARGMQFGLWVEPEMVSEDSVLYRTHPEWVLHTEGRPYTWCRDQLVLDLTCADVRDYLVESISAVLRSARIEYVKWDMNRNLTDVGTSLLSPERQGEVFHRYVLGLYDIVDRLTTAFPDVLWENCSSGGGRFDAGMMHYMPQTWCSDNTDAWCRSRIQYATSLTYPAVAMGAHVSASPNQQTGRITTLDARGAIAMSGAFGYELDLTACSDTELAQIAEQVALYKQIRPTMQQGTLWRIANPFEGGVAAWNFVSVDGHEVVAVYLEALSQPGAPIKLLKLRGLDPAADYRNVATGEVFGGDELMGAGVSIPIRKLDFRSELFRFERVDG